MSEPKATADHIDHLLPDVLHWTISDERIGHHASEAYAIRTTEGVVCIDPVTVREDLWPELDPVTAVLLTHGHHQRSAWRFRYRFHCPVYVPFGAGKLDEAPDFFYASDSALPLPITAVPARGFSHSMYLVYHSRDNQTVVFVSDLIFDDPTTGYRFPVQPGYFDPEGGVADAEALLTFQPDVLLPGHGKPVFESADRVLQNAIQRVQQPGA
ncbi:MAG: MBL fold metallo-hydrolase [Candidatus Neomarinimicrobiota bacterium]|nr:MAG: MBL fold metallo-hydrolase [Candidatus Neomarinimicrobiota bacterium]